jgi:hypothetical protein
MLAYTYISPGKFEMIDTTPLITHRYNLDDIAKAVFAEEVA